MEKLNLLNFYGYPVIQSPLNLKYNAEKIAEVLKRRYPDGKLQFIGIGTSGAMIMAALALTAFPHATYCIIRKEGESSHRGFLSPDFNHQDPAIVVDDEISTGQTMKAIANALHKILLERVEVVAVTKAYKYENLSPNGLKDLFPNLELVIT